MKEVQAKRFAGPFKEKDIPFKHFIQSPIGLVPKDGGNSTRLIFHLSYPRTAKSSSVNANTPEHMCSVKYPDFSDAIKLCTSISESGVVYTGKSDMKSAFRNLGILRRHWKYLLLKARSPLDGCWYYFFDKALPFGSAISCSHFQKFSNAVAHILKWKTGRPVVNYLDDYLFAAILRYLCNQQIQCFLDICHAIRFPVALEKTYWATTQITFLGFLIDTVARLVMIPCEKVIKGRNMIANVLQQKRPGKPHKMKFLQLQKICGFLNFLCRAIVPGRAFMRRLYSKIEWQLETPPPFERIIRDEG